MHPDRHVKCSRGLIFCQKADRRDERGMIRCGEACTVLITKVRRSQGTQRFLIFELTRTAKSMNRRNSFGGSRGPHTMNAPEVAHDSGSRSGGAERFSVGVLLLQGRLQPIFGGRLPGPISFAGLMPDKIALELVAIDGPLPSNSSMGRTHRLDSSQTVDALRPACQTGLISL